MAMTTIQLGNKPNAKPKRVNDMKIKDTNIYLQGRNTFKNKRYTMKTTKLAI